MEHQRRGLMEDLKKTFRPEFLNRLDEIIVFHTLSPTENQIIARRLLDEVGRRLQALGVELETEEEAVAYLAKEGFDRSNGARPLRRTIRRKVEDPAAELLLEGRLKPGDRLCLAMTEQQLELRKIPV